MFLSLVYKLLIIHPRISKIHFRYLYPLVDIFYIITVLSTYVNILKNIYKKVRQIVGIG